MARYEYTITVWDGYRVQEEHTTHSQRKADEQYNTCRKRYPHARISRNKEAVEKG